MKLTFHHGTFFLLCCYIVNLFPFISIHIKHNYQIETRNKRGNKVRTKLDRVSADKLTDMRLSLSSSVQWGGWMRQWNQ